MKVISRWNTSHECELCGKGFCGENAVLVVMGDGAERIIGADCAKKGEGKK